jgi:hypothetical protein
LNGICNTPQYILNIAIFKTALRHIGARHQLIRPKTILPACQRLYATKPDTHTRSFGQPTAFTHPNIMTKDQGKIAEKERERACMLI